MTANARNKPHVHAAKAAAGSGVVVRDERELDEDIETLRAAKDDREAFRAALVGVVRDNAAVIRELAKR